MSCTVSVSVHNKLRKTRFLVESRQIKFYANVLKVQNVYINFQHQKKNFQKNYQTYMVMHYP